MLPFISLLCNISGIQLAEVQTETVNSDDTNFFEGNDDKCFLKRTSTNSAVSDVDDTFRSTCVCVCVCAVYVVMTPSVVDLMGRGNHHRDIKRL